MKKFDVLDNKTIQQMEDETISFWNNNSIFQKSVQARSENNRYVFYDGPPFISGYPHYGHLLSSIAKDVIPRYWTMKGKRVERIWGWDAHGMPVENKVQQRLGIKSRRDIEKFGLQKFTEECYKYTSEVSAEWKWYVDKIGRWVDMDNAYTTKDSSYMESVLWAFKQLYEKGLIYEGVRTSLYCPTCGTPVSNFEVAMDNTYKEFEDPAITIKFKITTDGKFKDIYLLAWTTTPWTMPSNRALVVKSDEDYALVEFEGEIYIVGAPRVAVVFDGKTHTIKENVKGVELLGLEYIPPYTFFAKKEGEFKVYEFEGMVTMDDGTGIVHSAPGFGEIDTAMGRHYGLTIMMTLDDEGKFLPGDAGENPYAGMYYSKANSIISQDLTDRGFMFNKATIVHRIPFHDRCDTLLIQKAQSSWFIDVQNLKPQLLENNKSVNWVPSHLKEGRFAIGIEQAPDWCISRNRFWATPMPVWRSEDGEMIVAGSIKEIEELSGQKVTDLHRPFIDEIVIKKEGKEFKRVTEVLDCWMESGSMPFAQLHYPFENLNRFEDTFPGDFIVEYIAQVRAWFYVMHVMSTALFSKNSFKNVITTGELSGNDGRKMSKTYGNYDDPRDILEKIGGDALRLYLMGSPLMSGENANFDKEELLNKLKNVVNPLWNSAKFFFIYAAQFEWTPENIVNSANVLDKWVLTRLNQTIKGISESLENYLISDAVKFSQEFVDDLSRWFVRRSRNRMSSGDNEALSTMYKVLLDFSKAAAPIMPFITERIYQNLRIDDSMPESVHLTDYPDYYEKCLEENMDLISQMESDRKTVSDVLALRINSKLPIRQPLGNIVTSEKVNFDEIVLEETNVKSISTVDIVAFRAESKNSMYVFNEDSTVGINTEITEDLRIEGLMRDFIRKIQDLRKNANLTVNDMIHVTFPDNEDDRKVVQIFEDIIKTKVSAKDLTPGQDFSITKL